MEGSSSKSKPPVSLTPTVLLSAGHEWGYTLGFFLLFAAVAFFFAKLANGDFADWTLSMWTTSASSKRACCSGDAPDRAPGSWLDVSMHGLEQATKTTKTRSFARCSATTCTTTTRWWSCKPLRRRQVSQSP